MFHLHINNVQNLTVPAPTPSLSITTNGIGGTVADNGGIITTINSSSTIDGGPPDVEAASSSWPSPPPSSSTVLPDDSTVRFSIGRRNYEILSGTIRLFREDGISIESAMHQSSCTLLIVAVPSRITTSDLCNFLGPHLNHVEHLRIIKDIDHNGRYMVLLRMNSSEYSTQLYKSYNGRTFTSFDPELAHFLFVSQIRITSTFTSPSVASPSGSSSLPPLLPNTSLTNENTSNVSLSRKSSIENELVVMNSRTHTNNQETYEALRAMNHSPPLPSDPLFISSTVPTSIDPSKTTLVENYVTNRAAPTDTTTTASVTSSSSHSSTSPDTVTSLIELPTCPVCLERLDSTVSGMLTTLCNHTFHCTCLAKWEDDTCPVCRFCLEEELNNENNLSNDSDNGTNAHESVTSCEVCGVKTNLWLCLVCGHTGCGRYEGEHAIAHYRSSGHTYAIELSSQRVWDYTGDGYVHRLIHNKADGKVIELPDPITQYRYHTVTSPTSSSSSSFNTGTTRPRYAPDTDTVNGDITREKIDSIAFEYTLLLTHQLESQRTYFESMLTQLMSLIPASDTERKKEAERILYLQHGLTRSQKIVHPASSSLSYGSTEHTNVHTNTSSARNRSSRATSPIRYDKITNNKTTKDDDKDDHVEKEKDDKDDEDDNSEQTIRLKNQEYEKLNQRLLTRNNELEELIRTLQNRVSEAESKIISLERERRNAVRQVGVWKDKVDDYTKELTFLKEVNANQSANVKQWQTAVATAETKEKLAIQQAQLRIQELEEQVRDLMFTLDTQAKIMASDETVRNEVTNGQVLITENNNASGSGGNSVRARLAKKAAARNTSGSSSSSSLSSSTATTISTNGISSSIMNDGAAINADSIAAELLAAENESLGKNVSLVRTNSSSSSTSKQGGKKK